MVAQQQQMLFHIVVLVVAGQVQQVLAVLLGLELAVMVLQAQFLVHL